MRAAVVVLLIVLSSLTPLRAEAAQSWRLVPPDGTSLAAVVSLDGGELSLTVNRGGTTVLASSVLGIRTLNADLSGGLTFVSRSDRRVQERYVTAAGRRKQHEVDANETILRFTKGRAAGRGLPRVERWRRLSICVAAEWPGHRHQ
jgi:alpha-glucosidase